MCLLLHTFSLMLSICSNQDKANEEAERQRERGTERGREKRREGERGRDKAVEVNS